MNTLIFTDLDGTLLDEDGSIETALPAVRKLIDKNIPLVFVTSKTCAEVEVIQKKLNLWGRVPFIVENGGAIYIPAGYFKQHVVKQMPSPQESHDGMFWKIVLGESYETVRIALHQAAERAGFTVKGIGDMSVSEFAAYTRLPFELAQRGKRREYQEGYLILIDEDALPAAQRKMDTEIRSLGFDSTIGGGFCHIMKGGNKEKAVRMLTDLYRAARGPSVTTIGFGDAQSDLGFLSVCDEGYLVHNPSRLIDIPYSADSITMLKETGPNGVNAVIHTKLRI